MSRITETWITDGIILALIPASAYLWALSYEWGFCQHFDLPFDLISLNTTVVLAASGPTLFIISILFPFFVVSLAISVLFVGRFLYVITICSLIICFLMIFVWHNYKIEAIWYFRLMIGLAVVMIILSFSLYIKAFRSLRDKLRSYRTLLADIVEIVAIVLAVWVFAVFSFFVGERSAARKNKFQVIEYVKEGSTSELVVLRVYGDFLITAPLVRILRGENQIERKFVIFKMSDNAPTFVKLEKVGRLEKVPRLRIKKSPKAVP